MTLATCGVLCIEAMCCVVGSRSCAKKGQGDGGGDDDADESEPVLSFTEAIRAFESMTAFMYAHKINSRGQVNTINIERLLFSLKRKGANDFFKK
jgi:hypothetical protein